VIEQLDEALHALSACTTPGAPMRPDSPSSAPVTSFAYWNLTDGLLHAPVGRNDGSALGDDLSRVVYPSSYCYTLCPVPFPAKDLVGVVSIPDAHTMTYQGLHLSDELLPSEGVVNATEIARIVEQARLAQQENRLRVHMFLDQRALPSWAPVAYPGIGDYTNHDIAFQLDHPAARLLWEQVLDALMPPLVKALGMPREQGREHMTTADGLPLSYMVCNECEFNVVGGTFGLSAFQSWLAAPDQYNSSIVALNSIWGTHYGNFGDVDGFPSALDTTSRAESGSRATPTQPQSPSPSPSIRVPNQAAAYYDFSRFMGWRPADFFGWLMTRVRKFHPDAKGHIKSQNHGTFGAGGASGGIDRELVARNTGIVGADTRSMPGNVSKVQSPYNENEWQSFDWRAPALGYMFMRGIGRVPVPVPVQMPAHGGGLKPLSAFSITDLSPPLSDKRASRSVNGSELELEVFQW